MRGNFIVLKILFICIARSESQHTHYNAAPTYAYVSSYTSPTSYSPYPSASAYTSSTPQQAYTYEYPLSTQAGNHATVSYSSYPTGTSTYSSSTPQQAYSYEYSQSAQADNSATPYSLYPTGTSSYTPSIPQQAYSYEYPQSAQAGNPAISSYPTGISTYASLTPQNAYSYEYYPSTAAGNPATSSYSAYPTGTSPYISSSSLQAYSFEYPSSSQASSPKTLPATGSYAGHHIEAYNSLRSQPLSTPYSDINQEITPTTKEFQSYGLKSLSPNHLPPFSYDTSQLSALSPSSATNLQNYSPILGANSFMGTPNANLQAASLMSLNDYPLNNPTANTNLLNQNTLSNGLLLGLNSPTLSEVSRPSTSLNDYQNIATGSQTSTPNTKNTDTENQTKSKNALDSAILKKYKAAKIKALDRHIKKTVSKYVEDAIKKAGVNSHDQDYDRPCQSAILASTNESDYIDETVENLSRQNNHHIEKGTQKITVDHLSNTNPGHVSVTLSGSSAKNIDIKLHNQDQQVLTQNPIECNPQCCKSIMEKESAHKNLVDSAPQYHNNLSNSETQQSTDSRESRKGSTKTVNVLVINKKENNIGNTLSNDSSNKVSTESKNNEIINNLNENTVVANNTLAESKNDIDVINESNSNNVTNQTNKVIETVTNNEGNKIINKRFIDEDPLDETAIY